MTLLTKEMERPNGIGFSPDEKTLYVANSHGPRMVWMAFPVKADGTLGQGRVFFDGTAAGEEVEPRLGRRHGDRPARQRVGHAHRAVSRLFRPKASTLDR